MDDKILSCVQRSLMNYRAVWLRGAQPPLKQNKEQININKISKAEKERLNSLVLSRELPAMGDTIEFLKDLLPADRQEFLYGKKDEKQAIDGFISALPLGEVYTLRQPCGKIIAMGGIITGSSPMGYYVWLLCTKASVTHGLTLYKACASILSTLEGRVSAIAYLPNTAHIKFITKGFGFKKVETLSNKHHARYEKIIIG